MDNADQSVKGESERWVLESVETEQMVDVPFDDEQPSTTASRNPFENSLTKRKKNNNMVQDTVPRMGRQQSGAAKGIKSLRFLDRTTTGKEGDAWRHVEKRFDQLAVDGMLSRDNKEFAGELFDALARRRRINTANGITIDELREFWEDMTNHDLDARLQIFFDMCDKNGDGKLSEEEVKEVS
ncbi:NAD(P)H oxidase (H2O2-forming) [Sarracenia purpurea var. burkii]